MPESAEPKLLSSVTRRDISSLGVQVVDERGREIVRPDVLQAVVQLAQLGQLSKIRQLAEREQEQGRTDPRTIAATDAVGLVDLIRKYPHKPWLKAYFFNDGPNTVYLLMNGGNNWIEVRMGEALERDYAKSEIRLQFFHYRCGAGETASVRVIGKY